MQSIYSIWSYNHPESDLLALKLEGTRKKRSFWINDITTALYSNRTVQKFR